MQPAIIPIATTLQLKKIIVATDFSCASANLMSAAVPLARRYGSEMLLVHVAPSKIAAMAPETTSLIVNIEEDIARQRIVQIMQEVDIIGFELRARLLKGDPVEQLLDLGKTEHADLIIVGTHGSQCFKHFLLGSVAEEIFRRASIPVLIIGPHAMIRRAPTELVKEILVPTDLSEHSLAAIPLAVSIAHDFGARLHFLHILPHETVSNPQTPELSQPLETRMEQLISHMVPPSCRAEYILDYGEEAKIISSVACAIRADLVIMGLRCGSGKMNLLSSIAYQTIIDASCPVLTIRSK